MRLSKSGFSVLETVFGVSLLLLVLIAASNVLEPLNAVTKKSRMLAAMIKVENLIRDNVYVQSSYSDLSSFEIKNGNVIIAKHGVDYYVSEDLMSSDTAPVHPIRTRLQLVEYDTVNSKKGVLYQISVRDGEKTLIAPLGVPNWMSTESDMKAYLLEQSSGGVGATSSTIVIPTSLSSATEQKCTNGFIRGIRNGSQVACWNFQGSRSCPAWSLPVGYKMDTNTGTMQVLCQKLNRVSCPPMNIIATSPSTGTTRNIQLDNFYAVSQISLNDLYPPRNTASSGSTQCTSIVDFSHSNLGTTTGIVSAAVVTANGGKCPDENLYYKHTDGTCIPMFSVSDVNGSVSAQVLENPISVLSADQARSAP